jgi:hypothetical protein
MSSYLCVDNSNILNLLPVDLCRTVSNFICAGPSPSAFRRNVLEFGRRNAGAVFGTTIGVGHENWS